MERRAAPIEPPDADGISRIHRRRRDQTHPGMPRAAGAPLLDLDGFHGKLDQLLTLARAEKIDLAALSLTALVEQLTVALRQAPVPLGQKGDWVVMAAWLLQLRTRLLLPAEVAQQAAQAEAEALGGRLVTLYQRPLSLTLGLPASQGHCGRRAAIHALRCWKKQRRGWRAFARHDEGATVKLNAGWYYRRPRPSPPGWSGGRSAGATASSVLGRRSLASRSRPCRCLTRWNSSGPAWGCSMRAQRIWTP